MEVGAIVPAAGTGKRMQSPREKQFLYLGGKPILVHSLETLNRHRGVGTIVLVAPAEKIPYCRSEIVDKYKLGKVKAIIAGGKERQDSVAAGLSALPAECALVLVHDGVRPLASQGVIDRAIEGARREGAAVAALPVRETIKEAGPDRAVVRTLDRSRLWSIQTPQVFRRSLLQEAMEKARREEYYCTDEAALVERLGHRVRIVEGNPENIKVTTPDDLLVAETLLGLNTP